MKHMLQRVSSTALQSHYYCSFSFIIIILLLEEPNKRPTTEFPNEILFNRRELLLILNRIWKIIKKELSIWWQRHHRRPFEHASRTFNGKVESRKNVSLQFFIIHNDAPLIVCRSIATRDVYHSSCIRSDEFVFSVVAQQLQMCLIRKVTLMKFDISIFIKVKYLAFRLIYFGIVRSQIKNRARNDRPGHKPMNVIRRGKCNKKKSQQKWVEVNAA